MVPGREAAGGRVAVEAAEKAEEAEEAEERGRAPQGAGAPTGGQRWSAKRAG